jgi:hypothetical protein
MYSSNLCGFGKRALQFCFGHIAVVYGSGSE